jgi:uncharacterized protein
MRRATVRGAASHTAVNLLAVNLSPRAPRCDNAGSATDVARIPDKMQAPSPALARKIAATIADEIGARPAQVEAAVTLLDEGATVPFIARYRKEVTEGLDDTQLRNLETRLAYLRELEDRRAAILSSIDEQGKLDDALRARIEAADSKSRLEDLYLPYKPKRRTRAQIAREAGLEPLADGLLENPARVPE